MELFAKYSLNATAYGILNVSSLRPFYLYVSNFSRKAVRLPKHMAIAKTTELPTVANVIHAEP